MSNIDFDDMSEQELAALEASPTGDLLRSAAQAIVPQSQFSGRLEAQLRALPVGRVEALGAPATEETRAFSSRANRRTMPNAGTERNSKRIWRVASVGLGLAATLVMAFWLSGMFSSGTGLTVAGVPVRGIVSQGQVQHMTFTASTIVTGTVEKPADEKLSGSSPVEFWMAQENDHLVARLGGTVISGYWQMLTSENFYNRPDGNTMDIYKYPYGIEHINPVTFGEMSVYVLPDAHIIDTLLALPGASIAGESVLDKRNVTVVYAPGTKPIQRTEPGTGESYEVMLDQWFWVDPSTSQVIRVEGRFTTTTGKQTGFQFGVVVELTQSELLSRDAVPADFFTFRAGDWTNVIDGSPMPTAAATSGNYEFIPDGKVRLITLAQDQVSVHTTGEVYTETTHMEQFWLARGSSHPLMKTHVTVPTEAWTWIDENNYYEYDPSQNARLQIYAYDPKYQASVLPDPNIITSTLALPGAVSLGETTLEGRRALLIEVAGQDSPAAQTNPASPSKGKVEPTPADPANVEVEANNRLNTRYWIDLQTNQLLRIEMLDVAPDGSTKKIINYIAQDVLLDRATLIADFFTPAVPALKVGDVAPDFTLNDVHTGKPVSLSSLRGKPVVLNFWGTWCPPCQATMPITQAVYDSIKGKAEIVGVSMGPRDTVALAKDYVDTNHYTSTFVHDADYAVASDYLVDSVPTYVFIDANGMITEVHKGALTSAMFAEYLGQIDPQLTIANPAGVPSTDHPGWFVFTPFGGGFSVLMPKNAVDPSSRDNWEFYGVREGKALTYIAAYADRKPSTAETDLTKRLDLMVHEAATFMNGTARTNRKAITLDANPGLELVLDRTDGRFMRAHLYSVGTRTLLVYAIAQDEQALFTPEMDVYLNSLTLTNK